MEVSNGGTGVSSLDALKTVLGISNTQYVYVTAAYNNSAGNRSYDMPAGVVLYILCGSSDTEYLEVGTTSWYKCYKLDNSIVLYDGSRSGGRISSTSTYLSIRNLAWPEYGIFFYK